MKRLMIGCLALLPCLARAAPIGSDLNGAFVLRLEGSRQVIGLQLTHGSPELLFDAGEPCLGHYSWHERRLKVRVLECESGSTAALPFREFELDLEGATLEDVMLLPAAGRYETFWHYLLASQAQPNAHWSQRMGPGISGHLARNLADVAEAARSAGTDDLYYMQSGDDGITRERSLRDEGIFGMAREEVLQRGQGWPVRVSTASDSAIAATLVAAPSALPVSRDWTLHLATLALKRDRAQAGYSHPTVIGQGRLERGKADRIKCRDGSVQLRPCTGPILINRHETLLPALHACVRVRPEGAGTASIHAFHWGIYNPASSHAAASAVDLIRLEVGTRRMDYYTAYKKNTAALLEYIRARSPNQDSLSSIEIRELSLEFYARYDSGQLPRLEYLDFWEPLFRCLMVRGVSGLAGPAREGDHFRIFLTALLPDPARPDHYLKSLARVDETIEHINHVHIDHDVFHEDELTEQ